jgi:hypothetical protein
VNTQKAFLLSLTFLAAAVAAFFWWRYEPYDERAVRAEAPPAHKPSVETTARDAAKPLAPPVRREPSTPAEVLARQYESSKDRRAFYEAALKQPEHGGLFLAQTVVMECMAWVGSGKTNAQWLAERVAAVPASYPQRDSIIAALKRVHEPCLGFDSAPVPFSTFRSYADLEARDPISVSLKKLDAALAGASGADPLSTLLGDAARSGNPYLLYQNLIKLSVANSPNLVIAVDGKALQPAYWDAFAMALPAAACVLGGVDCTETAPGLTVQCARGRCYDDLYRHARAALSDAQFEQFTRFHDITAQALISKDFSRFGVLRKPK